MKGSGSTMQDQVKGLSDTIMEINTKESINKGSPMARETSSGKQEKPIQGNGSKG